MKSLPFFILNFISVHLLSQLPFEYGGSLKWYSPYFDKVPYRYAIDTLNGDTILLSKTDYFRINNSGDTIENLVYDNDISPWYCSDDGTYLTGRFRKWYPDKTLAEVGNYSCNRKVDEWLYYYPNGSIRKYENYFRTILQEYSQIFGSLSGLYKEYYENGNVKISGSYKIIMQYLPRAIFNAETYKDEYICCKWVLTSIKDGVWITYNPKGKKISRKRYFTNPDKLKNVQDISDMVSYSKINEIGLDTINSEIYLNYEKHK